jgi:hypothetical protein
MNTPVTTEPVDQLLERVVILGDLSKLSTPERNRYYARVCRDLGLLASTQPFAYLTLQGKTVLYATKSATDQLRAIHKISIEIIARELVDGIYTVRARSTDPSGRHDEDEGVVPLPDNVKGEFRSNMMMKATTKAKRRVTLSHCGLGMLDETEVETIRDAKIEAAPSIEQLTLAEEMQDAIPDHELLGRPAKQELHADAQPPAAPAALSDEDLARGAVAAADRSLDDLRQYLTVLKPRERAELRKKFGPHFEDLVSRSPSPGRE